MFPNTVSSLFLFRNLLAGVNSGSLRSPLNKEAILASNCGGTFGAKFRQTSLAVSYLFIRNKIIFYKSKIFFLNNDI